MRLLCRRCGAEAAHTCSPAKVLGKPQTGCPPKAAVWVYVTDYSGLGKEGIKVSVAGVVKPTDPGGFASYDPVEPGEKKVQVIDLGAHAAKFLLPESGPISAMAANGQISLIEFQISTWIEIRLEDEKGTVSEDGAVKLLCPDGAEKTETLSKEKLTKEGVYRLDKGMWPGDYEISFPRLYDAEWKATG
jgi:hypothetical protein